LKGPDSRLGGVCPAVGALRMPNTACCHPVPPVAGKALSVAEG